MTVAPETNYIDFLRAKAVIAPSRGLPCSSEDIHPILFPHQRDCVVWAVQKGRAALFQAFGLGKTLQQCEIQRQLSAQVGGRHLIVCPLGVRQEFRRDAQLLGMEYLFVRRTEEVGGNGFYLTNYESIRDGKLDPDLFTSVSLDEASCLRSFGSDTYKAFLSLFQETPYRFVATATPSPNRYKELLHYAAFLGIMDSGQGLTRFFRRDSTKANNLTLYPHMEDEFWAFLHSWAIFLKRPSDLGYSDEGYDLPELKVIYHEIPTPKLGGDFERDGQGQLLQDAAQSLADASKEKRVSIDVRVAKMLEIVYNIYGVQTFNTEAVDANSTRAKQEVLRREQGEGEGSRPAILSREQGENRPGEEARVHDGVPENVPAQKANRRRKGGAQPETQGEVCFRSGVSREGASECEELGQELSGEKDGAAPSGELRPIDGGVQCHSSIARGSMCNLSDGSSNEEQISALRGPRSRDGQGEGHTLPSLQLRTGPIQGQPGTASGSDSLPEQIVIFCLLNDEQFQVEKTLTAAGISFSSIHGGLDTDENERRILEWKECKTSVLLSKPVMVGSGTNLQQSCKMIFLGLDYKFNDFIQSCHRIYRFQQKNECHVHAIYTETEREVLKTLQRKWAEHDALTARMADLIRQHGLSSTGLEASLSRKIGCERIVVTGERFEVVNADCVEETRRMADASVKMILTSIPFGNHYEYSESFNDFGHNADNQAFFRQMDYLTPELLRVLEPGRIAAIHVKDRIQFGNVTGMGRPTVEPFHSDCIRHYIGHGFAYLGMITVVTDVVRENNQTYRLGYTEMCKDGTKMGVGSPEYVLLFCRLPSDTSKGYADRPVTKRKEEYSLARWQVDASAFWRTDGNRFLTAEELSGLSTSEMVKTFTRKTMETIYNYEAHVKVGDDLGDALPRAFSAIQIGSHDPDVWHDVNRMLTLNSEQTRKNLVNHICPLQIEIVERLIRRYSNPGDVIYDPFAGLGTVPATAVKMGRRGRGSELNADYFRDSLRYLRAAEIEAKAPTLFDDLFGAEADEVAA